MYCIFSHTDTDFVLARAYELPSDNLCIDWYHPYTGDGTLRNLAKLQ